MTKAGPPIRNCQDCGAQFSCHRASGRKYCHPCANVRQNRGQRSGKQPTDPSPSAAEVDRMLTEAIAKETMMPWER